MPEDHMSYDDLSTYALDLENALLIAYAGFQTLEWIAMHGDSSQWITVLSSSLNMQRLIEPYIEGLDGPEDVGCHMCSPEETDVNLRLQTFEICSPCISRLAGDARSLVIALGGFLSKHDYVGENNRSPDHYALIPMSDIAELKDAFHEYFYSDP